MAFFTKELLSASSVDHSAYGRITSHEEENLIVVCNNVVRLYSIVRRDTSEQDLEHMALKSAANMKNSNTGGFEDTEEDVSSKHFIFITSIDC